MATVRKTQPTVSLGNRTENFHVQLQVQWNPFLGPFLGRKLGAIQRTEYIELRKNEISPNTYLIPFVLMYSLMKFLKLNLCKSTIVIHENRR